MLQRYTVTVLSSIWSNVRKKDVSPALTQIIFFHETLYTSSKDIQQSYAFVLMR